MERAEALAKLEDLIGTDLVPLAERYAITIWKSEGKKNKGWAGHVIERHLGLPINSSQSPNFGSWELKVIPVKVKANGQLTIKETMAITMLDAYNVANTEFGNSHLLNKLRKVLICARKFENVQETSSTLIAVKTFDIGNLETYRQVEADYNLVRRTIIERGYEHLTGKMGVIVQPRTKGAGHGSTTRAFYARTTFLKNIFEL